MWGGGSSFPPPPPALLTPFWASPGGAEQGYTRYMQAVMALWRMGVRRASGVSALMKS